MATVIISQKDLKGIHSGVQRKVHEEIRYFKNLNYKVFVIAEKINKTAVRESGGVPIKTLRWPFSGYFRRYIYLKLAERKIKELKPDIIIGHGDIIDQDICYIHNCVHLAHERIHQRPISHDHEVGKIHSMILTEQRFKLLVCNSKLMQKDLTERFHIPLSKTVVIYPEYNPDQFKLDSANSRKTYREKFKVKDSDFVIGFITSGNFKKRNLDLLIEATYLLKKRGVEFKVLVAGKDNIQKYQNRLAELDLSENYVFAPPTDLVENYYHMIDVFTLPAYIEEFGRSVLEAMGCGKPVIVSDMVGCSELLVGKSREFILHDQNPEEFTQKLYNLFSSPDLCHELANLNYQTARSNTREQRDQDFSKLLQLLGTGP